VQRLTDISSRHKQAPLVFNRHFVLPPLRWAHSRFIVAHRNVMPKLASVA